MAHVRFGRVQLRIMQVLWARGRVTARQITEALSSESAIAHSTVQTLLRKLERKGAVAHDVTDRTFIFYPLVQAERAARSVAREMIDRMFGGSAPGLVCYLLEHEHIPESELSRIRQMITNVECKRKTVAKKGAGVTNP